MKMPYYNINIIIANYSQNVNIEIWQNHNISPLS